MALALSLALSACVGGKNASGVFRDPAAPIWSAAAFSPQAISGEWRQVAGFSGPGSSCRAGSLRFVPEDGGLQVSGRLCLSGRQETLSGRAQISGPGRLTLGGDEWWVIWVDSGYRTLAIGTPSGRFGFVLDRISIPADRLNAAREIFDFNGYDTAYLDRF